LVAKGGLRRRLTLTYAIVAALATGALALGSYIVVAKARLDDSVASSVAQARSNLALVGAVLDTSPTPEEIADMVGYFASQSGFETVGLIDGQDLSSSLSIGAALISEPMQALVSAGDLAFERVTAAEPYLVVGGVVPDTETELYFFFSERALRDDLAQLQRILLAGWVTVVVLSVAAGTMIARRVLRPVGRASAAARDLAEGLLHTRLPVDTEDELGVWAASFNDMAAALEEKIHALSEARAREKRFTSNVAHELRTPVTALATEASLLAEHIQRMPPDARRPAQLLVDDVGRLRRLIEELMEISRFDAGREEVRSRPFALDTLVADMRRIRGWEGTVWLEASHVAVDSDPRRVDRIVSNLIENALVHGGRGVGVRISRNGINALVEVHDRGSGIPPEHLPHVFDRFYKADAARAEDGSGLGLAIALENALLLGGGIEASSEPGAGSLFTLILPVAKQQRNGEGAET
jgi:two-component system sensor histidine kinase MtrB